MTDPIAVLAGTPVDTRMGVDCLTGRGLSGLSFPLSKDPREQTAFQYAAPAEKQRHVREILEDAGSRGCRRAFSDLDVSRFYEALTEARETLSPAAGGNV